MEQPQGQYRIIRVDGTETVVHEKPTIKAVQEAMRCDYVHAMTLTRDNKHQDVVVMFIDDTGKADAKENERAAALAREAYGPKWPWIIHGDVVIANHGDFA